MIAMNDYGVPHTQPGVTRWPLFDSIPASARDHLVAGGRLVSFGRHETVIASDAARPPVHLILRGRVGIEMSNIDGATGLIDLRGPYESVGATVGRGGRTVIRATALDAVGTIAIDRERFDDARRTFPELDAEIDRRLAQRADRLAELVLDAWFANADTRVLRRIADLAARAEQHGLRNIGPSGSGAITVTQGDLAALTGCTRPTVNRVVADAVRSGLLRVGRGSITVIDPQRLAAQLAPR
jgi:CRP/FNR family transcriptional regulator, cyclic AMP receptor protein